MSARQAVSDGRELGWGQRQRDARRDADGPQRHGGFSIGRLLGVEIRIDWSLTIIFGLVLFNLGAAVFPSWHPDWSPLLRWGVAFGAAVLFFGSVLVHELSHALVAQARGLPVRRITLFMFGGAAEVEREPDSPKTEFMVAIVGPLTSIAIGVLAGAAGTWLASQQVDTGQLTDPDTASMAMRAMGPGATLLLWLGPVNVTLGLFNMIPGFPLDGGRVLRSMLWWRMRSLTRATYWASNAGRVVAWSLMGMGVIELFSGELGGMWLILIGWFLSNAAVASYRQVLMHEALTGVPVRAIMRTRIDSVPPDLSVEALVRHVMESDQRAFPVQDAGQLLGIVCIEDVRKVPGDRRMQTHAMDIMTPLDRLTVLSADTPAQRSLEALARRDVDQLPIVEEGRLIGLLRRSDILKWVSIQIGAAMPGSASHAA